MQEAIMDPNTCLELALEGERLCKAGDFRSGVTFFEGAIQVGTDDLKTLSAIYSQLGNAYFYLGEYPKAMDYHKLDLTVARAIQDRLGEAKASGNLGNTLKVMGKFDEAVFCCRRHLDISQELTDKVGVGRALYNLGNVYHAKGKHIARLGNQDPGEFPEEVRSCLEKAVKYYEENLRVMTELGDKSAQGRAYGNLGNTHYLLGNFSKAIVYHEERLKIAKEFGDRAAERRAHSNLGNAHVFLGEFEVAAEHYKIALSIAQELGDRAVEAQACFSLGNTYTLLRDYPTAIDYHLRHLRIAQELRDRVGEGRAFWSLGNAHSAVGNHEKALHFARKHLEISKEIGDQTGQVTAQMSITDLKKVLGLQNTPPSENDVSALERTPSRKNRVRRISMENMDLLKLTPEAKVRQTEPIPSAIEISENKENMTVLIEARSESGGSSTSVDSNRRSSSGSTTSNEMKQSKTEKKAGDSSMDQEMFFELLSRFQSKRMDDQRCSLTVLQQKDNRLDVQSPVSSPVSVSTCDDPETHHKVKEELFDLIAGMQSRRMDEQRASLPCLPGLGTSRSITLNSRNHNNNNGLGQHRLLHRMSVDASQVPDDDFFDMLMRCQGSRIEDQRSTMPLPRPGDGSLILSSGSMVTPVETPTSQRAPTVPDEDFFSLILRFQAGRIDDQRSSLPDTPTLVEVDSPGSSHSSTRSVMASGNFKSSFKNGIKGRRTSKH